MFITQKCDKSSIWYRDSNPRPLEHESRPITTRPGLPSLMKECLHSDSVTHVVPLINVITSDCKEVVHVTMSPSRRHSGNMRHGKNNAKCVSETNIRC